MIPTLLPAYGRDYKTKAQIQADLDAGKDFVLSGLHAQYINLEQLQELGGTSAVVRYAGQRKVTSVKIAGRK